SIMQQAIMPMALPAFAIFKHFIYKINFLLVSHFLWKIILKLLDCLLGLLNRFGIYLQLSRFKAHLPDLLFHGTRLCITQATYAKSIGACWLIFTVSDHDQV